MEFVLKLGIVVSILQLVLIGFNAICNYFLVSEMFAQKKKLQMEQDQMLIDLHAEWQKKNKELKNE
jgi:type IV secretory pathway VirB3-like protein